MGVEHAPVQRIIDGGEYQFCDYDNSLYWPVYDRFDAVHSSLPHASVDWSFPASIGEAFKRGKFMDRVWGSSSNQFLRMHPYLARLIEKSFVARGEGGLVGQTGRVTFINIQEDKELVYHSVNYYSGICLGCLLQFNNCYNLQESYEGIGVIAPMYLIAQYDTEAKKARDRHRVQGYLCSGCVSELGPIRGSLLDRLIDRAETRFLKRLMESALIGLDAEEIALIKKSGAVVESRTTRSRSIDVAAVPIVGSFVVGTDGTIVRKT